jgi:ABC-type protease/lipase transport system fused ATPase/permease subunit
MAPVEQCISLWRNLVNARGAFRRIRHTLSRTGAAEDRMPLPKPEGHLSVSGVAFAPEGVQDPIFADVSFEAAPGEMLGVTGPSGAGKSSLVRMLIGANKPDHGLIRLDGADVFDWDSDDLGRHIGYVPQVVELLPGTIRENIARFSTAAPEKVVAAAKAAGIHDLILGLPRGYDTMVGGAYDILSVGARQRLALARALFDEPQLLVLDEPYSNLDAEGVTALVTALERLKTKGATVIIVAHRPSILAHADRVLLLQDGGAKMVDKKRPATFKVLNSDGDVVDETTSGDGKAGPDSIKKGAAQ